MLRLEMIQLGHKPNKNTNTKERARKKNETKRENNTNRLKGGILIE